MLSKKLRSERPEEEREQVWCTVLYVHLCAVHCTVLQVKIVAVDLQAMAPLPGVTQIQVLHSTLLYHTTVHHCRATSRSCPQLTRSWITSLAGSPTS